MGSTKRRRGNGRKFAMDACLIRGRNPSPRVPAGDDALPRAGFAVTGGRHALAMQTRPSMPGSTSSPAARAAPSPGPGPRALGKATIGRRLAAGGWEPAYPGWLRLAGGRPPVAASGSGRGAGRRGRALVSHESARARSMAHAGPRSTVTLTGPARSHHRLAGVVHQIDDVAAPHRTTIDGLPVVTAAARWSTSAATSARPARRRGRRPGPGPGDDVARDRCGVPRRGSTGQARHADRGRAARRPLRHRCPGRRPGACAVRGPGGRRAARRPVRQMPLPGAGGRGLVDAAYADARILLEADGRRTTCACGTCGVTEGGTRRRSGPAGSRCASCTSRSSAIPEGCAPTSPPPRRAPLFAAAAGEPSRGRRAAFAARCGRPSTSPASNHCLGTSGPGPRREPSAPRRMAHGGGTGPGATGPGSGR